MRSFLSCAAPPVLGFAWAIAYPFMPGIVRVHACGFASSNNATHHTCEHCKSVTLQGCRRLLQGSTLLLCGLGPAVACDKGLYEWWAWCRGVWVRVFLSQRGCGLRMCGLASLLRCSIDSSSVGHTVCSRCLCVARTEPASLAAACWYSCTCCVLQCLLLWLTCLMNQLWSPAVCKPQLALCPCCCRHGCVLSTNCVASWALCRMREGVACYACIGELMCSTVADESMT